MEAGKDDVTEILIANRADVNLTAEKGLEKPIHIAARCPTGKNCVVLLIKSGAEINALNEVRSLKHFLQFSGVLIHNYLPRSEELL